MTNSRELLYNPAKGQMRVAGFMSGSGSNLRKIIEFEKNYNKTKNKVSSPFKVVVIFSDTYNSNASLIGKDYDIPVVIRDLKAFCASRGMKRSDMKTREEFDRNTICAISSYDVSIIAYAGYMSIASKVLINSFMGVNIHPADLSIMKDGKRKYTGAHAVLDAILAKEEYISSTCHLVEPKVDEGQILMISPPLKIELDADFNPENEKSLDKAVSYNQERLKSAGDWLIFPRTLLYLAEGRYNKDKKNNLYFDGSPNPYGVRLDILDE